MEQIEVAKEALKQTKSRKKILVRIMKSIWFLAVIMLTKKYYEYRFGSGYSFDFSWTVFVDNFQTERVAVVAFMLIFIVAYGLEAKIFPFLISVYIPPFKGQQAAYAEAAIKKNAGRLKRVFGEDISVYIFDIKKGEKLNFIKSVLFIPCTIILWLIYANTWYAYVLIAVVVLSLIHI